MRTLLHAVTVVPLGVSVMGMVFSGLRQQMAATLSRVLRNPRVERKELAAFDLVMSRRHVVQGASLATVMGLVSSGTPPTLWGRTDPALHIDAGDVGLGGAEMASVQTATQLVVGTELFKETVYSAPAVSGAVVNTHAVIEGARGQLRFQSDLTSQDPAEAAFLDTGYHWGSPELVQLEYDETYGWELAHYHHPWGKRRDGAATDGLVRDVIMDRDDGLTSPSKILAITGPNTNRWRTGTAQLSTASYAILVEDADAPDGHHLVLGIGEWTVKSPWERLEVYPVAWKAINLNVVVDEVGQKDTDLWASDLYVTSGYGDSGTYAPSSVEQQLVLYYATGIRILRLGDLSLQGITVTVQRLPYPETATSDSFPHLVHIGTYSGNKPSAMVVMKSEMVQGAPQYTTWTLLGSQGKAVRVDRGGGFSTFTPPIWSEIAFSENFDYGGGYTEVTTSGPAESQTGLTMMSYQSVWDVNDLYAARDDGGRLYFVKLARFDGTGVCLFVIAAGGTQEAVDADYVLSAGVPLRLPDDAGVGEISRLSGGVSKFGGARFVASDDDGNVFILRQQRLSGVDSPYAPPIYGRNDGKGQAQLSYSSTGATTFPPQTASDSNLYGIPSWVDNSLSGAPNARLTVNLLVNAAAAFGTDVTHRAQAIWLGNTYQAAYALPRFNYDSAHVVIDTAQDTGSSDGGGATVDYSAYLQLCNPITKKWHTRQIAAQTGTQVVIADQGSHYQGTLKPANAYGYPVQLTATGQGQLQIEVRADSPTQVTDDTHNLYYEVDQYSSFMAAPDPTTGALAVVVAAATFAQGLYVRLVDSTSLSPSDADAAMLALAVTAATDTDTDTTTYSPWQSVNMAAQAQHRMGNTGGSSSVDLLGAAAPLVDRSAYITGQQLVTSSKGWSFKPGFTGSSGSMGALATYLNTSGQNLLSATAQQSLGATVDGSINPLTAVTLLPTDGTLSVNSTTFGYTAGSVSATNSVSRSSSVSRPSASGELGSIWSDISHALSDALHWLQHVADEVFQSLEDGAITIETAVDSITATVSADIMKAVNGVDQALNEIVTTVEELANVVANLVVTIVESSFLYQLIKLLIELISLFVHLKDIQSLSTSLQGLFTGILDGSDTTYSWPTPPSTRTWETAQNYLGTSTTALQGLDSSSVASDITQVGTSALQGVSNNPFTKKVLAAILHYVSEAQAELDKLIPVTFQMNDKPFEEFLSGLEQLVENLVQGFGKFTESLIDTVAGDLAEDLTDPQQTFSRLASDISRLTKQFVVGEFEDVFDFIDGQGAAAQGYAQQLLGPDQTYLTIKVAEIADLFTLFGLGNTDDDNVTVSILDALFFPMALVMWVYVYTTEGKSISTVADLDSDLGESGGLASSASTWTNATMIVNFIAEEVQNGIFLVEALDQEQADPSGGSFPASVGAWMQMLTAALNVTYLATSEGDAAGIEVGDTLYQIGSAIGGIIVSVPGTTNNEGTGWGGDTPNPTNSQRIEAIGTAETVIKMIDDAVNAGSSTSEVVELIGDELTDSTEIVKTFYNITWTEASEEDILEAVTAYLGIVPVVGFALQEAAVNDAVGTRLSQAPR